MTTRVMISGDKWDSFTWQLVEGSKVLQSGFAQTEVKAVFAGQDALIEHKRKHKRKHQRDLPWSAIAKAIPVDKLSAQNDT